MKYFNSQIGLVLLLLFIAIRLLFIYFPFWGLEYEDSFIYNDTGRYLSYNYDFKSMFFKCQSCLDGSFLDCNAYGSFGGHFMTFPFLLAGINSIFGYNYFNIFIVNLLVSIFLIGFILKWNYKYKNENLLSSNLLLLLFIITPFVTIFHTSGLSETLSSFFVIIFFLTLYKSNESDFKLSTFGYWLTIVALILAIVTKRENFILLIFLFCIPIFRYYFKQKLLPKSFLLMIFISSIMLLSFSFLIKLFEIETNEGSDIGNNTFSLHFLLLNTKQLFFALVNIKYWGITGYIFLASIVLTIYRRKISKLGLMSLVLILFYIVLYSSHYRSYYQVVHNLSHPFETLRYSINYLPLIIIFISSLDFKEYIFGVSTKTSTNLYKLDVIAFVTLLIINVVNTRIAFAEDEFISRIQPVEKMMTLTNEEDIIITDIPIVFHCYANENQRIVDMFSLTNQRFFEILDCRHYSSVYLIRPKDISVNLERYRIKFNTTHFRQIEFNSVNYELFKYSK